MVDDQVSGLCEFVCVLVVVVGVGSVDECDGWAFGLPAVGVGAVDALVVAVGAGGAEVVAVPPCAALAGGDDVVDLGGVGGAAG